MRSCLSRALFARPPLSAFPKEAWRISADSPVNDTYQPNFSPITLKSQYNDSDKIKDLFKFSGDTFKNVPNGINIYGQFGTFV